MSGEIKIEATKVTSGSFVVDMTTMKSTESQRDGQFQRRIIDTESFPTATFVLTEPLDFSTLADAGERIDVQALGVRRLEHPQPERRSGQDG